MEKRIPAYKLLALKKAFSTAKDLRITSSALRDARSLGFNSQDIVDAIQQLDPEDFVKSMTSYANHRIWQDVYNTYYLEYELYIKFQLDACGHFVISLKEK